MRITISGLPGSGKTSTGKAIAEKLKLEFISVGQIFRQMAAEKKMTVNEFNIYCEKHPEIDLELDERIRRISEEKNNIIIEGRTQAWICKADLKVWLEASVDSRTKYLAKRPSETAQTKKEMIEREKSEAKRYKKFHNIDINDKSVYDLIVDSDNQTVPQMVDQIIAEIKKRKLK